MLLKSLSNIPHNVQSLCGFFTLSLLLTLSSQAADLANSKLKVHGFVAQGAIDVNGSDFVNDDGELSFELTEVGLNASYQLSPDIRLAAQGAYLNGGNRYTDGFRIDYALIDWSIFHSENWQANIYIGRFKNYHWLYSSTRDIPHTRPSIILPQSVYFDGTRDMSVGGDGAALSAKYNDELIGELDFNISSAESSISKDQTRTIMGRFSDGRLSHDKDLQASIYWRPYFSQWQFGIALTNTDLTYHRGESGIFVDGQLGLKRLYTNAEYQGESWTFSVELLQEEMTIDSLLFPGFNRTTVGQGGFVQGQYQFTSELQLLARYEHYYANKDDKHGKDLEKITQGLIPSYFGYQNDATLGLTYHLSNNFQLQLEHHWIKGTARLTPVVIPDPTVNKKEYWQLSAIQLMYWF